MALLDSAHGRLDTRQALYSFVTFIVSDLSRAPFFLLAGKLGSWPEAAVLW